MNQGVIIGVLAFLVWGSVSSWWYVCKIKGLCEEPIISQPITSVSEVPADPDTASIEVAEPVVEEPVADQPIVLRFETILFQKNSDELADKNSMVLISKIISDTLGTKTADVLLTGHTCDLGTDEHNQKLGRKRAEKVKAILESEGINGSFTVQSRGETQPLNSNTNEEERAQNRRVAIDIKTNDQ